MADTYLQGVKLATVKADGLDTTPIHDLETALTVLRAWFPLPVYRPAVLLSPEDQCILDGAFWRYEACKQLAGYIEERKNPKPKNENAPATE
jgi:hypothetical protein